MILSLRPEIQRYIDDQVKSGRFPTPEAVIEHAILEAREAEVCEIDDETAAAINEAEEQADRGEGMDLDAFRAHISKRFTGNG